MKSAVTSWDQTIDVRWLLEESRTPAVAINRAFRVTYANSAALGLLQLRLSSVVGKPIRDFVPHDWFPARHTLRELRDKKCCSYEVGIGDHVYLCQVTALGEDCVLGWGVFLADVTPLKELDRLKSQMIQMTSHDLKNPLQAAMSYIELMIEDGAYIFTEDMHYYINVIWTQLSRMYRIISGILDLERIQAGTPAFEEFGLEELLGRVVVDLADHARTKGVTLELELDERLPLILGDAQLLGQAIANLVENAVKFTLSGGVVQVKAQASGEHILIDVIDTGIGIPEDEIDRVFDRFFQGRRHAHLGGTGMGLALVKAIVDSHRGKIDLESEEGRGTVAHVRLPVSDELEF